MRNADHGNSSSSPKDSSATKPVAVSLLLALILGIGCVLLFTLVPKARLTWDKRQLAAHAGDGDALARATFLLEHGNAGIDALLECLHVEDPVVRWAATKVLAKTGRSERADVVTTALVSIGETDPDLNVRVAAGWSLRRLGRSTEGLRLVALSLTLQPGDHEYGSKRQLVTDLHVREGVASLLHDLDTSDLDHASEVLSEFYLLFEQMKWDLRDVPSLAKWNTASAWAVAEDERHAISRELGNTVAAHEGQLKPLDEVLRIQESR